LQEDQLRKSIGLVSKDRSEVSTLVQHANYFDDGIRDSVKNRVRVNQDRSQSRHYIIPRSPKEWTIGEPLTCIAYLAQ